MPVWLHYGIVSWSQIYAHSVILRTIVEFAHVGGLLAGGGSAVVADRGTLSASRRDSGSQLKQALALHLTHRIVVASLIVVTISGLLLLAADLDTYLHSLVFWIKMALIAMLLANGGVLSRAGRRALIGDATAWPRLRRGAAVSLTLWFAITFLGAALSNV